MTISFFPLKESGRHILVGRKEVKEHVQVENLTKGTTVDVALSFSNLVKSIVKAVGKLAVINAKQK